MISKSYKAFSKPNVDDGDVKNERKKSDMQTMFDFDCESKQDSMQDFNIKTIPILSKLALVSKNF